MINFRLELGVIISILLASCGGVVSFKDKGIRIDGNKLQEGTSAFNFNETLFPILSEKCGSCHGDLQAPLFAISDNVISSHDNIIENALVDFQNAGASRLVLKVKANHNCWTSNCDSDADDLKTRIQTWALLNGEGGGGDTTKPKSQELLIPNDIPQAPPGTPYYLSLSLDGIAGIPSGSFIDVAVYELNESAYVFGPLGVRSSVQLFIKKVDLQINKTSATPTYHPLFLISQANTGQAPGFVLSTATPLIPTVNGRGVDQLRFVFDEIRPATQQEINNFAQLQRFNTMQSLLNCGGCHLTTKSINGYVVPAFETFTTPEQFKNIPQGTLPDGSPRFFVAPGNPNASTLWRSVADGVGGNNFTDILNPMPPGSSAATRTPIANAIQQWIVNEAP